MKKLIAFVIIVGALGTGGWAYLLEVEGTAVLVAGNVREQDIESMIESLNRR